MTLAAAEAALEAEKAQKAREAEQAKEAVAVAKASIERGRGGRRKAPPTPTPPR